MLFNHKRERVQMRNEGDSLCPECGAPLVARRGEVVVWHWAHAPNKAHRASCAWEESSWHLRWKQAFHQYEGYEVEFAVNVGGKKYVLDAYRARDGRVREFVHSLSPSYAAKHQALARAYPGKVSWLFDGHEFGSLRSKPVRGGGIRGLLKPRAKLMHDAIGGYVHIQGGPFAGVWKHWKHDIWYRIPESDNWLKAFEKSEPGKSK